MSRIRVTGGSLKGRGIEIEGNNEARYTPSKVREAIFDIIGDVEGKAVLDLFAGSGSFTIEALSRGAGAATSVERDSGRWALIRRNLDALSLLPLAEALRMEVRQAIPFLYKKGRNYDIIFMDPPYDKGYVKATMSLFGKVVLHNADTLFVVEHSKRETIDAPESGGKGPLLTKRYGDTCISIFTLHTSLKGVTDET